MALYEKVFYANYSVWLDITPWSAAMQVTVGDLIRQSADSNTGRVFVALNTGQTGVTEPTWTTNTRGWKSASDNGVYWMECTGLAGVNGDLTSCVDWTLYKAEAAGTATQGQLIKRNNLNSLQICTTTGTFGANEPSFSDTAGVTTQESGGTAVWTSLGAPGNFAAWGAAGRAFHQLPGYVAGCTCFVGDNHALYFANASWSYAFPGTQTNPNYLYSVDHTITSLPPRVSDRKPGATEGISTGNYYVILNGNGYVEGFSFLASPTSGTNTYIGLATANNNKIYLKNCALALRSNGNLSYLYCGVTNGGGNTEVVLDNTTLSTGNNAGQFVAINSKFTWKNTPNALTLTVQPSPSLFMSSTLGNPCDVLLEGLDLSALTNPLLSIPSVIGRFIVKDCKLSAATAAGPQSSYAATSAVIGVDLLRSDSGDTNYKLMHTYGHGTLTTETTVVRDGGATDGTTPISWKIETSQYPTFYSPFECPPITIWNENFDTEITVTLYGIWDGAHEPTNEDLWFDVAYLGDASYPLASIISNAKACSLSTPTAHDGDSSSWEGSTTPFLMSVAFTPQAKGYISITPKIARPSDIFYIDPQPVLS